VSGLIGLMAPAVPEGAQPEAKTADFHVVCTNPDCGHHFLIHEKFGFHRFPVVCPACGQKTGAEARRCFSETCRGRWVAPREVNGKLQCPVCGQPFE
jgi:hypothetical protein